jgi:uncharacterized protein (TIGR02246 family)
VTDHREVATFFERYAATFNALDPEAVTTFYHVPCMMIQPGSAVALGSREAVLANMTALVELYRAQGYQRASFADLRAGSLGPTLVLVTVAWTIHHRDGASPVFRNTYELAEIDGQWRIVVSTTHESGGVSS